MKKKIKFTKQNKQTTHMCIFKYIVNKNYQIKEIKIITRQKKNIHTLKHINLKI